MTFVAADQLRSIVERVERIEADIKDLNSDKSDVYQEANSLGFDKKTIRKVVQHRKVDAADRAEADAMFETYWNAVHGLGPHVRVHEETTPSPKRTEQRETTQ